MTYQATVPVEGHVVSNVDECIELLFEEKGDLRYLEIAKGRPYQLVIMEGASSYQRADGSGNAPVERIRVSARTVRQLRKKRIDVDGIPREYLEPVPAIDKRLPAMDERTFRRERLRLSCEARRAMIALRSQPD